VSSYATGTHFPLDGAIVIRPPWPEMPADMPSMRELFTLTDLETGEAVDYAITYVREDNSFELRPSDLLLADRQYELVGDHPSDAWTMHYLEGTSFPTVQVTFNTGGELAPVQWTHSYDGTWYIGWTEALDQPLPEGFTLEALSGGSWTPVDPAALSVYTNENFETYDNVLRVDGDIEPADRLRIVGPTPERSLEIDGINDAFYDIVGMFSGLGWCEDW